MRAGPAPLGRSFSLLGLAAALIWLIWCGAAAASGRTARLLDVQWSLVGEATRVTMLLSGTVRYRTGASGEIIHIDLWILDGQVERTIAPASGVVSLIGIKRLTPDVVRMGMTLREPARFKVFTTDDRLTVMVFPARLSAVPLPRSVAYESMVVTTDAGRTRVHVVTLDPRGGGLQIQPALGGAAMAATEPTSVAATRLQAVAAINGNYYSRAGLPLGLVVIHGRVLSAPLPRRTVFAVDAAGRPWMGQVHFDGRLLTDSGLEIPISAVNRPPRWGGVALYTPEFGPMTPSQSLLALIRQDRVIGFSTGRPVIPPDGYVLAAAASQQDLLARLWRGQKVTLSIRLTPPGLEHALQGGPRLVRGGRVFIPYAWEEFSSAFSRMRTARSAIGITAAGKVLLVTADGRTRRSAGMNLPEVAEVMWRLGAVDAMNLDGGGSATLVVGGRVVNALPAGGERMVSAMLMALPRSAEPAP